MHKKSLTAFAVTIITIFVIISPIIAQQEEQKDPCPVHDDSSAVHGVEKLSAEERDLYDELWASFGEAGNIAPPLTTEALSIVAILADLSDDLNDADKSELNEAGKNYLRSIKIVNQVFPMLVDPSVVKDKEKVKLIKELTAKLKQLSTNVRDWVASWAKRLNLPNLGIVSHNPSRFTQWEEEVAREKDGK